LSDDIEDVRRLRLVAELIAVRIGDKLNMFRRKFVKESRGNLVWSFDLEAEEHAIELVRLFLPKSIVVTEERGTVRLSNNPKYIVVLDPVDGSNNLAHDIPWYCTCVAISYSDALDLNDVVASAVYAPSIPRLFSYSKSEGVFVDGEPLKRGTPMHIVSAYFEDSKHFEAIEQYRRLRGGKVKIRSLGSIALELCYLAWGRLEGVIDLRNKLRNTDIAAPYPMIRACGGYIKVGNRERVPLSEPVAGLNIVAMYSEDLGKLFMKCLTEVV